MAENELFVDPLCANERGSIVPRLAEPDKPVG
jgi:hypothetical protein